MKEKIKPSVQPKIQKEEKEERIPWYATLEVRDLINPIILRRVRIVQFGFGLLLLAIVGYYVWENFLRAPTGTELVNEMVEAAGGMEAWNNIKSGQFTRNRSFYSESGEQLSHKVETFYFQKTDGGVKLMVRSADKAGNEIWISEDGEGFWATKADKPVDPRETSRDLGMMCDSKFCQPNCTMNMMFYRFSMPFKLTDYGVRPDASDTKAFVILDWDPLEFLRELVEPLVLDVSYMPTVGRDKWRFIVDNESKLIQKVEYYNKSDFGTYRPEEIIWSDHKTVDGITFSHNWKRYWANGQVMDETTFSEVSFNDELPEQFFNRPEGLDWLSLNQ